MRIFTIILFALSISINNLSAQFSYLDSLVLLNDVLGKDDQVRAKEISKYIEKELEKSDFVINKYDKIIELAINESTGNQGIGYLIHKKGIFLYKRKEYDLAISAFKRALELRMNYPFDKATSLYMIGVTLEKKIGLQHGSIDFYQKALDEYILLSDTLRQIRCRHRIGIQYDKLREFDLAEKNLENALNLEIKNTERYSAISIDLSAVYYELQKYGKAEKCLLESIAFFEKNENSNYLNYCYNNLGNVYDGQKKYNKALEAYFKGLKLIDTTDLIEQSRFSLNVGETYLGLNELDDSKKWLNRSLSQRKMAYEIDMHPEYNTSYHNLGVCYLKQEKYQKAIEYFQLAISSIVPDYKPVNIFSEAQNYDNIIGDYQGLLDDLSFKGKAFNEWYEKTQKEEYLEAAFQSFKEFGKVMELMQNEFATESSRLFWLDKYYPDIEIALEITRKRYNQTGKKEYLEFIHYTIEQNKAIVLLENLRKRITYKPKDYAVYKSRENTLVDYRTSLIQSTDSIEKDSLIGLIRDLEIKQEEWKMEQKENSPFVHSSPPTIEETQQNILNESSVLLNYFVGDSSVFCLVITKKNIDVFQFEKNKLQEEIKELRNTLQNPPQLEDNAKDNFKYFANNAWSLAEHIINPILRKIPDHINELIILSDGELNFIPFNVLLRNEAKEEQNFSSKTPYLLQQYNISYGYSSAILLQYKDNQKKSNPVYQLAVFAPDFNDSKAIGLKRTCSDALAKLVYNKNEAEEINDIFSVEKVNNNNKAYFKERMNNTRIIHLASHACINENATEESRIFLEDEPLFLHELYAMDNQAEMVVLSACETGLGELKKGEGVMSLSRAFAYSGVPSTTMSLWSVNDESTKNLMVAYYQELKEKNTKHTALANAQKAYLAEVDNKIKYHPFYWAAFVHYGDTERISLFSSTWYYWLGGIVGLFLLGLLWFKMRRKT